MPTAGPSSRSACAPGADWEDSYFNLDSRYRQLQKKFNEQQEELKQAKVLQRKEAAAAARRPNSSRGMSVADQRMEGSRPRPAGARSGVSFQPPSPQRGAAQRTQPNSGAPDNGNHAFIGVPNAFPAQANDAYPRALHIASLQSPDSDAGLPDPAMIWGAEGSVQNYVAANALYHANEELRRKLEESSALVQALQQELSSTRTLCTNAQARIEDLAQQMHQLVRERDVASQKLATAQQSIRDFERTLESRVSEEERIRFSLESQIAELRSRLIVGADSNEMLTRDVRALLSEAKEKTGEVVSLRSKLALAEANLSSQRNTNENLLLELRSMNHQLVEERKRLLTAAREVQAGAVVRDRVADLEGQVRRLMEERAAVEGEHSRLMGNFVRVAEDALRHAREEVRADIEDWRGAAQHWEEVSQLLYKDVAERTQAHIRCRAECDEAKAQRDMVGVELRSAKEELALCRAKLDVVWPTHDRDAGGLSADEVLETFRRRSAMADKDKEGAGDDGGLADGATGPIPTRQHGSGSPAAATYAEALGALPVDSTTAAERIFELQEANAGLVAELEQLRLTNEMLQDRIHSVRGRHDKDAENLRSVAQEVERREKAGQRALAQQLDRVQFLEAQVRSLRGYQVSPNTGMQDVAPSENVLELFLGQLVGAKVPAHMEVPEAFSQLFCSADFLLHETVTTPTITGLNGFFDITASFCISMDALLLYYLQTRKLLVQLHRIRTNDEVDAGLAAETDTRHSEGEQGALVAVPLPASTQPRGSSPLPSPTVAERMFETVAEGEVSLLDLVALPDCLDADRPTLKGHVRLVTPSGRHVASLEFQLTARSPFTEEFKQIVRDAAIGAARGDDAQGEKEQEAQADRPQPTRVRARPSHRRSHSPDPDGASSSSTWSARGGMREWLRRSSSTTSSSTRVAAHGRGASSSKRKRGTTGSPRDRTPTGMQLVSASSAARRRPGESGTSSVDSSSLSAAAPAAVPRLGSSDLVRLHLRGGEGQQRGGGLSAPPPPPPLPQSVGGQSSFAHIARNLLLGADPPQPPTTSVAPGAGTQTIHSVAVDVVRLELPADLPTPIPRLSCFYALPALRREVRLAAPASPQYTVQYAQPDATFGTVCAISSLAELAALAREPVAFFLVDEDAPGGTPAVWAMALCEWTAALSAPEVPQSFTLPLLEHAKTAHGGQERRLVRSGVLRVRLVASTKTHPRRESMPVLPSEVKASADLARSLHVTAPIPALPGEGSRSAARTPNAPTQRTAAPAVGLAPSSLTALQHLMQQVREREGKQAVQHPVTTSPAGPAEGLLLSMEEQLMQLEYERMLRR